MHFKKLQKEATILPEAVMTSSLPQSTVFYLTPTGAFAGLGRRGSRHHGTNVTHLSLGRSAILSTLPTNTADST